MNIKDIPESLDDLRAWSTVRLASRLTDARYLIAAGLRGRIHDACHIKP